jgi:hypothetical protein
VSGGSGDGFGSGGAFLLGAKWLELVIAWAFAESVISDLLKTLGLKLCIKPVWCQAHKVAYRSLNCKPSLFHVNSKFGGYT